MAATTLATKTAVFAVVLLLSSTLQLAKGANRRRMELYQPNPADMLSYHPGGDVLHGNIAVSLVWYGAFTPAQKAIVSDFLLSLTVTAQQQAASQSVAGWWNIIAQQYLPKALQGKLPNAGASTRTQVLLANQVSDARCSMGKSLTLAQVAVLAASARPGKGGVTVVLTAQDVTVEGFCMSRCALHGSDAKARTTYIWVGNSATQCPGQCAWPFAQPQYGPQSPPLRSPNGDVGMDGIIINLASMLAGAVTNPFGDAYYQGSRDAPLEAATACPGVFGNGAYPGYAGDLKVDGVTGASYNANGANGRKYLLPALCNPSTAACSTSV